MTEIKTHQFQVAMVLRRVQVGKKMDDAFRQQGIRPLFFTGLEEFWLEQKNKKTDMLILDVQLMNQRDLLLKDHPLIESDTKLLFYYDREGFVLIESLLSFEHLGLINGDAPLGPQIAHFWSRVQKQKLQDIELDSLRVQAERFQKRIGSLISESEDERNFRKQAKLLFSFQEQFEEHVLTHSFYSALEKVFKNWPSLSKFSLYELHSSGQKLIPLAFESVKSVELPSLWLGQVCENGIDFFAEEMAMTVALDVIGPEIDILKITGPHSTPDLLLFIEYSKEDLFDFPWKAFELTLSAFYQRSLLGQFIQGKDVRDLAGTGPYFWTLLYSPLPENKELFTLDLSSFLQFARSLGPQGLQWQSFFEDFASRLTKSLGGAVEFAPIKDEHFIFRVAKDAVQELEVFCERFPYWNYFADSSRVLGKDLMPDLRPLNPRDRRNFLLGAPKRRRLSSSEIRAELS